MAILPGREQRKQLSPVAVVKYSYDPPEVKRADSRGYVGAINVTDDSYSFILKEIHLIVIGSTVQVSKFVFGNKHFKIDILF